MQSGARAPGAGLGAVAHRIHQLHERRRDRDPCLAVFAEQTREHAQRRDDALRRERRDVVQAVGELEQLVGLEPDTRGALRARP